MSESLNPIDHMFLTVNSDSDVNLSFANPDPLKTGNAAHRFHNDKVYRILVTMYEDWNEVKNIAITFTNRIYPDCTAATILAKNAITLQTVNPTDDPIPMLKTRTAPAIVLADGDDVEICGKPAADIDYEMTQINYPGGGFDPNLFEISNKRTIKIDL